MNAQTNPPYSAVRQRGAALIVSLLILLVMTILGVASMQTTVLEEKMASNARDKQLSFQAAEAALREGENWLQESVALPDFTGSDGLYQPDNNRWKTLDWSDNSLVVVYPDNADNESISQVAAQPRYYMEELPLTETAGSSLVIGLEPPSASGSYRITARGVGGSSTAVSILQTTFIR